MKIIIKLKLILPEKITESNALTTAIAPYCEPFSTRDNKKGDYFSNNCRVMISSNSRGDPKMLIV